MQHNRTQLQQESDTQEKRILELTGVETSRGSQKHSELASIRRSVEGIKDSISSTDNKISLQSARMFALEKELSQAVSREKIRINEYCSFDKENYSVKFVFYSPIMSYIYFQLKSERNILRKEVSITEGIKNSSETSCNEFPRETK